MDLSILLTEVNLGHLLKGIQGLITRILESDGEIFVRDDKLGAPRFFRLSTQRQ